MSVSHAPARRLTLSLLLAGALVTLASAAFAQYVWVDEKGVKQFSDRPPPTSIPDKNIIKSPGRVVEKNIDPAADPVGAAEAASGNSDAGSVVKAEPTLAERNADFRKRKAEQAEIEKKAADEARRKAEKSANCDGARRNKTLLESGGRISTVDKSGERGFMSDNERAAEVRKAGAVLAECK